jgi:hypothetical protein
MCRDVDWGEVNHESSVFYLCFDFPSRTAMGQVVRRHGMFDALNACGVNLETVFWPRRSRFPMEMLSARLGGIRALRRLGFDTHRPGGAPVLIEGLPLAIGCLPALVRRSFYVHVDVCDSWLRLSDIGSASAGTWRTSLTRSMKRSVAAVSLHVVSAVVDSVSYISENDMLGDARFLHAKALVIENTSMSCDYRMPTLDASGPLVTVGDWRYPPNRRMLESTLALYVETALLREKGLRIVGPHLPERRWPTWVEAMGWVDDLAVGYEGVSGALALVDEGAGVNNKVLDAVAFGVPIIASQEALNGISVSSESVFVTGPRMNVDSMLTWLDQWHVHERRESVALTNAMPGVLGLLDRIATVDRELNE